MAKKIEVIIGADNQPLKDALKDSQSSLKSFSAFTFGLVSGFAEGIFEEASHAIKEFFAESKEEALAAQRVVNSIQQSLEGAGRSDVFGRISNSVEDLHHQFQFLGEADITSSFDRLIQMGGLTELQINRLVPLIIDLNAKQRLNGETNKSLADTTEQVVRALQGQSKEMKNYGIEVSASKSLTENLAIILENLPAKVKNAGDAFANSLEGRLAATREKTKDLQTEIGEKLIPLKLTLISFALDAASAFDTLYQKMTGTYEATQKAKKSLESLSASKENAKNVAEGLAKFLGSATEDEFNKFIDGFEKQIDEETKLLGDKIDELRKDQVAKGESSTASSDDFPILSKSIQANRDIIDALKERRRLEQDKRTIGKIHEENNASVKTVDLLKERIATLKEIVALQQKEAQQQKIKFEATDAVVELKDLEIQLIRRDTRDKNLAEQLIKLKFPEFSGEGLHLVAPTVTLGVPVKIESVSDVITKIDAAGDDLAQHLSRMYNKLKEQGEKDGKKAREEQVKSLEELTESINSSIETSVSGIGEGIGALLSGGDPVSAFIGVIANALQSLGQALIAFGVAKRFAIESLKSLDPFIAIAAGVAAVAAGALLRKKVSNPMRLAEGGITNGPTIAMIGEAGREVVAPLDNLRDLIGVGSGVPELVETKERGGDIYRVWKFHHARNNRLNP